MGEWVDVYEDSELGDGDMAAVGVGEDKWLILRSGGDLRACRDVCPHKGAPLSDGDLADGILTCNAHLREFDVKSGESVSPGGGKLDLCPIRVNGQRIEIQLAVSWDD
jgi:toluene monooxygenase system ferredoxin subunit